MRKNVPNVALVTDVFHLCNQETTDYMATTTATIATKQQTGLEITMETSILMKTE